MHRLVIIAALVTAASEARAEAGAEITLGGVGPDAQRDGRAMLSTSVGASIEQLPNIGNRAIGCEPMTEAPGCVWFFTGTNPRETDQIGAAVDGSAWADGGGLEGTATARVWARGAGWKLEERLAIQPVGDLRDRIWLSGRGVVATRTLAEIAPMFTIGTEQYRAGVASGGFEVGQRWRDGERDPGFDWVAYFQFAHGYTPHLDIDLMRVRFAEQLLDKHEVDGHTYGISASGIDIEALSITAHASGFTLAAHIGVTDQTPVYHSVSPATATSRPVPQVLATDYGVETSWRGDDNVEIGLGIGSWLRLKPEAESLDYGHLASATLSIPHKTMLYRLRAQGGYLDRIGGSPFLPPPPRTREWMGRLDGEVAWRVSPHLDMISRLWGERSDRDDVRWTSTPMSNVTHVGAELTARFH